jgi:hypothetical protein
MVRTIPITTTDSLAMMPPPNVTAQLLEACRAMLEVCGSSAHWHGQTHDALVKIEGAVAAAEAEGL